MTNSKSKVRKTAVALGYDPKTNDPPRVLAKGKGLVAGEIIERAKDNDVPVQEDASLVEVLGQLELNERIPEELYQAVAEVLAFLYRLDKLAGEPNE
ncbi:EscU/YscU/HrcU family type III secretion system export apparatus switch protein [Bacillus sp. REN3]|uniref:EscU/YscU/HrcU family type III secretion system export apparatus switch protein n=1 Tax=Bacillus sp. REN3 TaxID=2802440 RepID=UPI001AED1485|nr:EscU/YscU/HrcU family type III secretion system export apparatus switch protein [Bacillus sp. REN3]